MGVGWIGSEMVTIHLFSSSAIFFSLTIFFLIKGAQDKSHDKAVATGSSNNSPERVIMTYPGNSFMFVGSCSY